MVFSENSKKPSKRIRDNANIKPRSQKSVDKICENGNGLTLSVVFLGMSKNAIRIECKEGDLYSDFKTGKI